MVEPHRHEGVFIARGKEDVIVTFNSTPGKDVYGKSELVSTARRTRTARPPKSSTEVEPVPVQALCRYSWGGSIRAI